MSLEVSSDGSASTSSFPGSPSKVQIRFCSISRESSDLLLLALHRELFTEPPAHHRGLQVCAIKSYVGD